MVIKARFFLTSLLLLATAFALSSDAVADIKYGQWKNTGECRCLRVGWPTKSPCIPGVGNAPQECKWCRQVEECTGASKYGKNPIRCWLGRPECRWQRR